MTDEIDRQIVAALIRNGRAPFRLIADVLGQQERTVSRRANKLLASGAVRIQSFPNPMALGPVALYMLRVTAEPRHLDAVCAWLTERGETHWISSLSGSSQCVAEIFLEAGQIQDFLYGQLAQLDGVRDFALDPIFEYYRTVSGWRPDILSAEQYEQLSEVESPGLITRSTPPAGGPLDESSQTLIELLRVNGRATIEELATGLGVSKTTASRRLEAMVSDGVVYIRAILDPGTIGYPVEGYLTVSAEGAGLDALGRHLADLPTTRWAANVAGALHVQGAFRSLAELHQVTREVAALRGVRNLEVSLYAGIYKRSTVAYQQGKLPPLSSR